MIEMHLLPRLSDKQLEKLSDISSDVALVALASVVLPAVLDRFDLVRVILGLLAAIGFWIFSLCVRK